MLIVIVAYVLTLMTNEKQINNITACASDIRKVLLETANEKNNIAEALKQLCTFAKARATIFFNTDGEDYRYIAEGVSLDDEGRKYLRSELFRYVSKLHTAKGTTLNILSIKPNKHLYKTNPAFYNFLKENNVFDISLSGTATSANHITILAALNAKRGSQVRLLAEKTSACFSMALYNKNYLNKTKLVATTDSLTGALNRVAYKNDLLTFDEEKPSNLACIYIDVNELHLVNNKFGHAAGDEMLIFIANTLKDVFYGHKIYRMGGDEFLVFCKNIEQDFVKKLIKIFVEQLKPRNYHVATGLSFRTQNVDTEDMVKEAEVRMYEAKAKYYQNKEQQNLRTIDND
jgi:diguanylate cyclase (GGDEF)-like protein